MNLPKATSHPSVQHTLLLEFRLHNTGSRSWERPSHISPGMMFQNLNHPHVHGLVVSAAYFPVLSNIQYLLDLPLQHLYHMIHRAQQNHNPVTWNPSCATWKPKWLNLYCQSLVGEKFLSMWYPFFPQKTGDRLTLASHQFCSHGQLMILFLRSLAFCIRTVFMTLGLDFFSCMFSAWTFSCIVLVFVFLYCCTNNNKVILDLLDLILVYHLKKSKA